MQGCQGTVGRPCIPASLPCRSRSRRRRAVYAAPRAAAQPQAQTGLVQRLLELWRGPKPSPTAFDRELEVAVYAVQVASHLTTAVQERIIRSQEGFKNKKDKSPVTVADYGAQAVISLILARAFPGAVLSLVGEEDATELRKPEQAEVLRKVLEAVNGAFAAAGAAPEGMPSLGVVSETNVLDAIDCGGSPGGPVGRHWVLDPVDGTVGFLRGDQYAISLGLVDEGKLVAGVLGCPNLPTRKEWLHHPHRYFRLAARLLRSDSTAWAKGYVFLAQRHGGCFMEPCAGSSGSGAYVRLPVRASLCKDPALATFCEPVEKGNSSQQFTGQVAETMGIGQRPMRIYSSAKYGAVARGDAEVFMKFPEASYKEKSWDHAAGVLIVEEAGGRVTDAGGAQLDFSAGRLLNVDRGIIAACSSLHPLLVSAVESSWASSML